MSNEQWNSALFILNCSFAYCSFFIAACLHPTWTESEKVIIVRSLLLVFLVVLTACGCTPTPPPQTALSVVGRDAQWKKHLEEGKLADERGKHTEAEKQ